MKYKVTLNNRTYEVEVEQGEAMLVDEYEAFAPAAAAPAPAPAAPKAAGNTPYEKCGGTGESMTLILAGGSDGSVGGVTPANVADYIKAGCAGVGASGALVNKEWIAAGAWDKITATAAALVKNAQL